MSNKTHRIQLDRSKLLGFRKARTARVGDKEALKRLRSAMVGAKAGIKPG